jgi:hypothetical protein
MAQTLGAGVLAAIGVSRVAGGLASQWYRREAAIPMARPGRSQASRHAAKNAGPWRSSRGRMSTRRKERNHSRPAKGVREHAQGHLRHPCLGF